MSKCGHVLGVTIGANTATSAEVLTSLSGGYAEVQWVHVQVRTRCRSTHRFVSILIFVDHSGCVEFSFIVFQFSSALPFKSLALGNKVHCPFWCVYIDHCDSMFKVNVFNFSCSTDASRFEYGCCVSMPQPNHSVESIWRILLHLYWLSAAGQLLPSGKTGNAIYRYLAPWVAIYHY